MANLSSRSSGKPLWLIGPVDGGIRVPFHGSLQEAVAEANRLHRLTGKQHSAMEAGS